MTGTAAKWNDLNPFRYRGYYYDSDTGLYYLQSRYYDPETGRFINSDSQLNCTSVVGYNTFAYCENNPVLYIDYSGNRPIVGMTTGGETKEERQQSFATMNKNNLVTSVDPNIPPEHPDFKPPKGGNKKTRNPNGNGKGWLSKDGGVWIPNPRMHGGEGWEVQYPNGKHKHAYPGGKIREHYTMEAPEINPIQIFVGTVSIVGLVLDDLTIVGTSNDCLIPLATSCVVGGIGVIHMNCAICGEEYYGF